MFRSLRWRIQIWHALILAGVIFVFASAMYIQQRQSRMQSIDNELAAAVEVLVGKLQAAPPTALQLFLYRGHNGAMHEDRYEDRKLDNDLHLPKTFSARRIRDPRETPYFVIWRDDGVIMKGADLPNSVPLPPSLDEQFRNNHRQRFRNRNSFREAYAPGPPGTYVLVGRLIEPDLADLNEFLWLLVGTGFVVFAFGLAGGWVLSRNSVRPIEQISRVAAEVSEQSLSKRIGASDMDTEFAVLAQTLNDTFARLESAFDRQAQFTADASHELRTPLSIIQMHQQLALSKERSPQEYRESIETCEKAASRMSGLVESLLTLARLDTEGVTLAVAEVDLASIVGQAIDDTQPLAESRDVLVSSDLSSARVSGDAGRLAQVVMNLLTNAITYSSRGSDVVVSLGQAAEAVVLTIADTGYGIPASDLAHIFERFYRVDKQRSRDSGGSGLGLAICQSIVEAHHGQIEVQSEPNIGSTFKVTLPSCAD